MLRTGERHGTGGGRHGVSGPGGGRARPVEPARRPWLPALLRGLGGHCPACGAGALFARGLQVNNHCPNCGEDLYHHRANRLSWLLAGFVGVQVVLALMWLSHVAALSLPLAYWVPVWAAFSFLLLRPAKGAIVGLQWALRLHGFQYAAMCRPYRAARQRGQARGKATREVPDRKAA